MRRTSIRLAVTVVAALTLAGGGTSAYAADTPQNGAQEGHTVVVKGDDNQVVLGDRNVVGGGDVTSSGHSEAGSGEGDETTAPAPPYATVRSNVSHLAERERPTENSLEITRFGPGTKVPISCFVAGESVHGNNTWYRVRQESEFRTGYISAYYTTLTGAVNRCE